MASNSSVIGSFYRAAIPQDILEGSPNPSNWGLPSAALSPEKCEMETYFKEHSIIFGELLIWSLSLFLTLFV